MYTNMYLCINICIHCYIYIYICALVYSNPSKSDSFKSLVNTDIVRKTIDYNSRIKNVSNSDYIKKSWIFIDVLVAFNKTKKYLICLIFSVLD